MTEPLVSFCMSTYMRPVILERQLNLLLQQEYKNFEIVISDNDIQGSGQTAVEKINDPRIKYFVNDVNLGMVKSFNKSVERSFGDYIVMITDDDPLYPDMLSSLIPLIIKKPGYSVYAGCGDIIVDNAFSENALGRKIGTNRISDNRIDEDELLCFDSHSGPLEYLDGQLKNVFILWSCCLVRRDAILETGGMPDYGSEFVTDHAYVLVNTAKNGIVFLNKSLGGQEVRGDNFGFSFEKLEDKFIHTPSLFVEFLKSNIQNVNDRALLEKRLWTFIGRNWVEYSLMIYKTLPDTIAKKKFFRAFNLAFGNREMRKWKLKFFIKLRFEKLFNILIRLKK